MSKYVELPIDQIELDKSNPRIANFLALVDKGIHNKTTKYGLPTY